MNFLSRYFCFLCDDLTSRNMDLCFCCEQELPFLESYCQRCANSLPIGQKKCGSCFGDLKLDLNTVALFHYQLPIDQIIIDLKFNNNLVGAKVLGGLFGDYLADYYRVKPKPEVIIPVPLHFSRLKERGYNQALELSRPIAKRLKIPIDRFSVKRFKNTLSQAKLSARKRKDNIRRAFCVKKSGFCYQHVAVVDDVITTGNTVFELCRVLSRVGVKKIEIWCLAKAD